MMKYIVLRVSFDTVPEDHLLTLIIIAVGCCAHPISQLLRCVLYFGHGP
jgi:hypothetical protein